MSAAGLTAEEAARRLRTFGPNAIAEQPAESLPRRFARQFRGALVAVLLLALGVDLGSWLLEGGGGIPTEGIAIGLLLLLNAALGTIQEGRAERALAALKRLSAPRSWALRDGRLEEIPSADLVPGDVLRIEAGDRVPADLRLGEGTSVSVDESILTGESFPLEKGTGDEVFGGTLLVRGTGFAEVLRTGPRSAVGRLAEMLGGIERAKTPLERRLEAFGRRVARWVVVLASLLVLLGVAAEGIDDIGRLFLLAVALAVAAIPEGLPAVLTLTLAFGVERMARRNALVRRLPAVEALGSVTAIATDKTGTITENRMRVRRVAAEDEGLALRAMVLANDAEPGSPAGDPTDVALLDHARERGLDPERVRREIPRLETVPFDSARKWMRVTVREDGRRRMYWKGAPEVLVEIAGLDENRRRRLHRRVEEGAREGLRVLALGAGEEGGRIDLPGLVFLWDPPRPEVPAAIRRAREAGIRVLLVTGDHPETALAVGRAVGIESDRAVTGAEIEAASESESREIVARQDVFARVSPAHKLRLVEALQANGEIVAMTGDGVNDAPALRRADVGVAMGRRGSDVAREVASLVLLDDNFATIVAAAEEGRSLDANVQKFVRFLFATNFSEVVFVVGGAVASYALDLREADGGLLLPLTAAQILWINLLTDGLPALALSLDRNPGVLRRPPRGPDAPLLDRAGARFVFFAGGALAGASLLLLAALPRAGLAAEEVRSATFLAVVLGQLLFPYFVRRIHGLSPPNRALHLAIGAVLALQIAAMTFPPLRALLGIVPVPGVGLLGVAAALALVGGTVEGARRAGLFGGAERFLRSRR